jgi:hypothetical protein
LQGEPRAACCYALVPTMHRLTGKIPSDRESWLFMLHSARIITPHREHARADTTSQYCAVVVQEAQVGVSNPSELSDLSCGSLDELSISKCNEPTTRTTKKTKNTKLSRAPATKNNPEKPACTERKDGCECACALPCLISDEEDEGWRHKNCHEASKSVKCRY